MYPATAQFEGHLRVAGNHDWAALDRLDIDDFNPEARKMVVWTRNQLNSFSLAYLQRVPDYPIEPIPGGSFTVTHASPRHPVWEYVYNTTIARENFDYFDTPYCLVGHTHVPRVYRLVLDAETGREHCTAHAPVLDLDIGLRGDQRLILNPGSVGQPATRIPSGLRPAGYRAGDMALPSCPLRLRSDPVADAPGRPDRAADCPISLRVVVPCSRFELPTGQGRATTDGDFGRARKPWFGGTR